MSQVTAPCPSCARPNRAEARFCSACGARLHPSTSTALPANDGPVVQGRYRITRLLGKGGFGEVYLAQDSHFDRACVIKQLVLDESWDDATRQAVQEGFAREARLLASLNVPGHPVIPEIYEYLPAQHALVMKYIEGQSIARLLDRRVDGLPEHEALCIVRDVCAALTYMHRRPDPVLHRDIKPANILRGDDGRVWLIDFGLAKALPLLTHTGDPEQTRAAGTVGFAPPEQWLGEAEPRSDVYSLAATLWIMLTNQMPSDQRIDLAAPVNTTIRPELEHLIRQALAPEIDARPTAQGFLDTLETLLDQRGAPRPPEPRLPPPVQDFVGREREVARIVGRLEDARLTVITGLAGVGKTALAAAAARRVADPRMVFWYSFHEGDGCDSLIWALAGFLAWRGHDRLWQLLHQSGQGGQVLPPEQLLEILLHTLQGQRLLLCLDDVQWVDEEPLFAHLLKRLHDTWLPEGGTLLITSRQVPDITDADAQHALHGLDLTATRAFLARRGITLDDALFVALHTATEGNPQLLILAAETLRRAPDVRSAIAQLAQSDSITRYLLREVHAQLDEDERTVMIGVAFLLDYGGTRDAVEAVLDRGRLWPVLQELSRRQLLTVRLHEGEHHYGQHALVQAFYYHLPGKRERQALHQRAGSYYETEAVDILRAARHYERASDYARTVDLLTGDIWLLINRGHAHLLGQMLGDLPLQQLSVERQLAVNLGRGDVFGLLRESQRARTSYEAALALVAALPATAALQQQEARICRSIGWLLRYESPSEAISWLRRGLAGVEGTGSLEEAIIRVRLGTALESGGEYALALHELETSLCLLPAHKEEWRGHALVNLGIVYAGYGDSLRAMDCYNAALDIYERTGNTWGMIAVWHNLGIELEIAGDWRRAATLYQQALEAAEQLGLSSERTDFEIALGILRTNQGQYDPAMQHLQAAICLAREYQLHEQLVNALASMADLYLRLNDAEGARPLLEEARALAGAIGLRARLPEISSTHALLSLVQTQVVAACATAAQAVELARTMDLAQDLGVALRVLGQARSAAGQYDEALDSFAESLALLENYDPYQAARTRAAWGTALLQRDPVQGQTLLHDARHTFKELGALGDLEATARPE